MSKEFLSPFNRSLLASVALLGSAVQSQGVVLVPLEVTSGFNHDLIANGNASALATTTSTFDTLRAFYSADFGGAPVGTGLPSDGKLTAVNGGQYELGSYSANNALRMSGVNDAGTLTVDGIATSQLGLLVYSSSGSGTSDIDYVINFVGGGQDSGSFSVASTLNIGAAGNGFVVDSHVRRSNDTINTGTNTAFAQVLIDLPLALQAFAVTSIEFTLTSSTTASVFAVSAVPEPSTYAALAGILALLVVIRRRRSLSK